MAPRVLISDKLSPLAKQVFTARGINVDSKPGLDKAEFAELIGGYDGLVVRSATKVTEKIIAAADNLKVVGRAGIGIDNIDLAAATAKGVIVMNTPYGNSITTAEHAIAMMLALARQIPAADISTQAGKWEKTKFMGVEVTGKTLGVIGCGNIGSIAANRALGLHMRVLAYDPFLSDERAADLSVEKVKLDELFKRADFISLHTPLTDKTRHIIDAKAMKKMKKSVRIINCARGGLIDEKALKKALDSGQVAGAALDVFEQEPAAKNMLFGTPNVICTPHLGAATTEAQQNVAVQVAEQMADFLLTGAIANAVNFPSISAEEAPKLKPFVKLAEQLGSFAGQLTESGLKGVRLEYAGEIAEVNTRALSSAAIAGVLRPMLEDVNMVSSMSLAKERGIAVEEVTRGQEGAYETYLRLTLKTERQERSVAGTVFSDGKPRVIQVKGINMEAELGTHMLYTTNADQPGYIGAIGTLFGENDVNVATFALGRQAQGGDAIALIEVDERISDNVLEKVRSLPHVVQAQRLYF